ncbi:MAG TPA: nitronate monooxygenase, partial [Tepidiformaceae bacterium]|nr:nitronate monooxygenase [Tepidiformaceae bacterium]
MSNRVAALFGIQYPVVMGAISSVPELAAAISNAGGLGCMAGAAAPAEELRARIQRFRELSDKPFAINFPIVLTPEKQLGEKMQLMLEERVPVVITSAGNPKLWTTFLKEGGCRVAHVLPTLYHAQKAVEAGVDAIIAEPAESGGYRGEHEVSMMVLIPAIRRAFPGVPLLAAGAVADGAGLAAVMALGAEGVQLGTRFLATVEANAPEHVRKLILAATDTSTMSAEGRVKPRVSKPEFAMEVLGEKRQTQMGQVSALITDMKPVEEVMRELIEGGFAAARRVADSLG